MGVEFLEAPAFTRHLQRYLEDDEYAALQQFLAVNPEAGDVIPGTGGFRKLRWVMSDAAKDDVEASGLSITFWSAISRSGCFTVFGKDEAADLTTDQKRQLRAAI